MIRAGRSQGGQPMGPGPAEPGPDRSGDPARPRETSGPAPASGAGTSAATLPAPDEPGSGADAGERPAAEAAPTSGGGGRSAFRRALGHTWVRHLILIVIYQGAGIAATWPRFTYLADGRLPATSDVSSFVWNIWWSGHQVLHLSNPFFTKYMAAPVGTHLAFSTLMPLGGSPRRSRSCTGRRPPSRCSPSSRPACSVTPCTGRRNCG